jgi:hypothetical protein
VTFDEKSIIATIALSGVWSDSGSVWTMFRRTNAECAVFNDTTPTEFGYPIWDPLNGQVAQLTTSWVEFWLKSQNASAAAVACIYDGPIVYERLAGLAHLPPAVGQSLTPQGGAGASGGAGLGQPLATMNFEIVNRRGRRVGYHQEVQLEGGAAINADETIRRLEARKLQGVKGPIRGRVVQG